MCKVNEACEASKCIQCRLNTDCPKDQICKKNRCCIPKSELCNGRDDDCDGKIDEFCVLTFSGSGTQGSKDGPPTQAQFDGPHGFVFDGSGYFYVVDYWNYKIKKIDMLGNVSSFAGSGKRGFKDGPASQAQFDRPAGLAFDASGNLYIADYWNNRIRKIDLKGNVTTFAGSGTKGFKDGPPSQAQFNYPAGIAFDPSGNLYVVDQENNRIRKIDSKGNVTTFAGSGTKGFKDGPSSQAQFNYPNGIAFDSSGNLYIADFFNNRIRKIDSKGNVTTFAGSAQSGYLDGLGIQARFDGPTELAFDSHGLLYVTDQRNNRIRRIDPKGNVTTIAGSGKNGFLDGPGIQAQFNVPYGLAFDPSGHLYITDQGNHRIRKILLP